MATARVGPRAGASPAGNGHDGRGFAPRLLTFRARMGVRATISIQEAERARLYDW